MSTGTVAATFRWPVKSLRGERVEAVELAAHGAAGDRAHALADARPGKDVLLSARVAPRLLLGSAAYATNGARFDPADPPEPELTSPDGARFGWSDPALVEALEEDLGRPVALRRDPSGQPDVPGTVLVTSEASRRALEQAVGHPIAVERFRPNVHLDLGQAPAWFEAGWVGARIEVEDGPLLEVVERCDRCAIPTRDPDTTERSPEVLKWLIREQEQFFGVRARVVRPGLVATGAAVRTTD